MQDKRKRLAHLLDRIGITEAVLRAQSLARAPWLTILTYHRVIPASEAAKNRFDDSVVDATPEVFERQVIELKRYFDLIGVDELCAFAEGQTPRRSAVALTFDDGYRDNHDIVLPILRRHDVKATFFVATSFVSERRLFWWDRIWYLLKQSKHEAIELEYPVRRRFELGAERMKSLYAVLRIVKSHYALDLPRLLDNLARACGVEWSAALERRCADELIMTWDQVRALHAAGMDVESHTRHHNVLKTLPPEQWADELAGSRDDLQRGIGRAPRAVAYPTGDPVGEDSPLGQAIRAAGYRIGLSNGTGTNRMWQRPSPLELHRMPIDGDLTVPYFRGMMALPLLSH